MDAKLNPEAVKAGKFMEELYRASDKKLRVLAYLPASPDKPTQYYRMVQPLATVGAAHQLSIHFVICEARPGTAPLLEWADIVIFQQYHPIWAQGIQLAKEMGKIVIFETDDFLPDIPAQIGHQRKRWEATGISDYYRWACKTADYVWVASKSLGARVQKWTKEVPVFFPNALNYEIAPWNLGKTEHEGVHIGYLGSLSHATDVFEAVPGLLKILSQHKNVMLYYCGVSEKVNVWDSKKEEVTETTVDKLSPEMRLRCPICVIKNYFKDIPAKQVIYENWRPLEYYPLLYQDLDFVIAPLNRNSFNKCKSSIKIAEAGAFNLPIVATNIEPYKVVDHYIDGFLVTLPKKWTKYLRILISDTDRRREMGEKLGEKARELFNIEDWTEKRYEWLMRLKKIVEVPKLVSTGDK